MAQTLFSLFIIASCTFFAWKTLMWAVKLMIALVSFTFYVIRAVALIIGLVWIVVQLIP